MRCLERDPADRPQRVEDALGAAPHSRRWFLGAAGVLAASSAVAIWAKTRPAAAPVARPHDVVAFVPLDGDGPWIEDAWRTAFTVDLHDALVTAGIHLLALHSYGQERRLHGRAAQLTTEKDPTAAAFAIERVTSVVRARLVLDSAHATLELEIHERSKAPIKRRLTRPRDEIALLVIDTASLVARQLGFPEPRRPNDLEGLDAALYERYGSALSALYSPLHDELAKEALQPIQELVAATPGLVRAVIPLADVNRAVGEQKVDPAKSKRFFDKATSLVDDALSRDPDCAFAHATRGYVAMLRWDWPTAEAETARGVALAPHHERVFGHRNILLLFTGRFDEAVSGLERETLPDPRIGLARLGWTYYYARRWQDVVRVVEPVLDKLRLDHWIEAVLASSLALAYAEMAQIDRAAALADKLRLAKIDEYSLATLASVYAMAGRIDDAKAIQDELGDRFGLDVAALMADALGRTDEALTKLEQLVDSHNFVALGLKIERFSIAVRSHPRYQALLKRVGFPA